MVVDGGGGGGDSGDGGSGGGGCGGERGSYYWVSTQLGFTAKETEFCTKQIGPECTKVKN